MPLLRMLRCVVQQPCVVVVSACSMCMDVLGRFLCHQCLVLSGHGHGLLCPLHQGFVNRCRQRVFPIAGRNLNNEHSCKSCQVLYAEVPTMVTPVSLSWELLLWSCGTCRSSGRAYTLRTSVLQMGWHQHLHHHTVELCPPICMPSIATGRTCVCTRFGRSCMP